MASWMAGAGLLSKYLFAATSAHTSMMIEPTPGKSPTAADDLIVSKSAFPFVSTLEHLVEAIEKSGMTLFARIDHQAAARQVGLEMPPTTVLIYGNPKGGTPLMLAAPAIALDLPLRILIREDTTGATLVSFHPAIALTRAVGLPDDQAAGLSKAQTMMLAALQTGS